MNLNPRLQITRPVVITSLMLALFVGLLAWYIFSKVLIGFSLSNVTNIRGGLAGCGLPLYDNNGNLHQGLYEYPGYEGPAPLYRPNKPITTYAPPCPIYPEKITPAQAVKGETFYPVYFELSMPRTWIGSSESTILTAKTVISDTFTAHGIYAALPFTATNALQVGYKLSETTLDFDPPNNDSNHLILLYMQPAEYKWVISPKENKLGKQSAIIYLQHEDMTVATAKLDLEVRPLTGLSPVTSGLLAAIGGFVIGLLGAAKMLSEVVSGLVPFFRKSSSERPRTKNRKTPAK